jgi:hypothetical protein
MSFFGSLVNAVNPVTHLRAAAGVVRNPFNPLAQVRAVRNAFAPSGGGAAAPAPSAYGNLMPPPGAPQTPPSAYGNLMPDYGQQQAQQYAPPPPPPPMGMTAPPGGYGPPQYGPADYASSFDPTAYGGDTGWDAQYGGPTDEQW